MGFLSDLFKNKRKNVSSEQSQKANANHLSNDIDDKDDISDNTEDIIDFDENGWLNYPDGIKLITIDYDDYQSFRYFHILNSLGYEGGELYVDYYKETHLGYKRCYTVQDSDLRVFSELFTDKLIFILRHDGKKMTIRELESLKSTMKKNRNPEWGLSRYDLLDKIGDAIEDRDDFPISKFFIERVFKCTCVNNSIDVNKFHFEFDGGILCACSYDGFDVKIFIAGFSISDIEDYMKYYSNHSYMSDDIKKRLINYHYFCQSKIDHDILNSKISVEKFEYKTDDDDILFCMNYIAMAAHYKQCDVEQEMFILSTLGQYEIISKETFSGVTTTKIRAYRETFTFMNGHTMPELISNKQDSLLSAHEQTNDTTSGYVYVMINSSFDGLVKIGKTSRDPDERAKELSSATGVPTPFVVVFYKEFDNCDIAESQIHQFLTDAGCRVNDNRDFFRVPVKEAIEVVQLFYDKERILHPLGSSQEELSDEEVSCLIGTWKSTRMKFDDTWYDVSKERFAEFGRTVIFNNDGTFEESSAGTDHIGTYKIIGRDIHTYLQDGKYIIYHINSVNSRFADMTLVILDNQVQIEFEK